MSGEDIKTKVCSKCGKELPMTDEYFYKSGDRYQSLCKECKRQYDHDYHARVKDTPEYKERIHRNAKKHRQRVKGEFVAKWKKPCQKCGEQRLYLIQFHHIDPATKEFNVATNVLRKKTKTCEEEVKKCVCLCSNCHDEFHYFYGANPEDPVNAIKEYLKE